MTYCVTWTVLIFGHLSNSCTSTDGPGNYIKCLVPNQVAGMIIGKDGQNIQKMMEELGVTVRVSSSKSFFPGTQMRIVSVMGAMGNICKFVEWVLGKMADFGKESGEGDASMQFKVLISNFASGVTIGKGGANIKALQAEAGVTMNISQKDAGLNLPERILTITGPKESVYNAITQVLGRIQSEEDAATLQNMLTYTQPSVAPIASQALTVPTGTQPPQAMEIAAMYRQAQMVAASAGNPFTTSQGFGMGGGGLGGGGMGSSVDPGVDMTVAGATRCTIDISVPEYLCGALLGQGGETLREMQQMSGATIKLSNKGEYIPGSFNRMATIRGNYNDVHNGYYLLMQKLAAAYQETSGKGQALATSPASQGSMMNQLQSYYSQLGGGGSVPAHKYN